MRLMRHSFFGLKAITTNTNASVDPGVVILEVATVITTLTLQLIIIRSPQTCYSVMESGMGTGQLKCFGV